MVDRRRYLIEDVLPLKELSAEARREKAIRHGHISTLHVWWARRPLIVARAAVFGALLPVPLDERQREELSKFIVNLCRWETDEGSPEGRFLLEKARELIGLEHAGRPPRVLDSMGGGGSIPLEAFRLGCQADALEYNPVAYLILRGTVEFPQRYGPRLADDVRKWGDWVLQKASKELAPFYPNQGKETAVAYIWCRTVSCPNCKTELPLFRTFWLAHRRGKHVALTPVARDGAVDFEVRADSKISSDPSKGTVRGAVGYCISCNSAIPKEFIRNQAQEGRLGHRLVAIVSTSGRGAGRIYTLADEEQQSAFRAAADHLTRLRKQPSPWPYGLSLIPEEGPSAKVVWLDDMFFYGMTRWGDLFNARQALGAVVFGRVVREAHEQILKSTHDADYARAIVSYLAMSIDRLADYNSVFSVWNAFGETIRHVFAEHNVRMGWDYVEINPSAYVAGGWKAVVAWIAEIIDLLAATNPSSKRIPMVSLGSSTKLPYGDQVFDAVVVDPPYYDNVPYADLSDFFYVWLRRIVGDLYPEAFGARLTPKDEEIVHNPSRWGGGKKGEDVSKRHFERLLTQAFLDLRRVVKPEGALVVMFTHRKTEAWERLILSLLEAGLYPTASFPVHTEMESSTHQRGKGAIQSTILMACRRRTAEETGWYHEIRKPLEMRVREKLETFWNAGIRGADFFISAIGPAVEVFGQYAEVRRPGGRPVEVGQLLEEVRTIVADYALQRLGEGIGQTDESTRFYVLFRWAYGNLELDFDEVNKLCKALGVELDDLVQAGLAWKKGGKARLYTVTERWHDASEAHALIHRFADEAQKKMPLIDALHGALALWRMGDTQGLQELLTVSGQMESELFWRTAQALFHVEDDWLGQQSLGQQQIGEDEDGETETEAANKAASGVSALREEHKLLQQFLKSPATLKSKVAEQIVLELER